MNIQRQKWKTNFTEYFVDQIEHRTPFNRLRFPVRGTRHPRARRDVEGCSSIVRRRQRGTMARKAQRGGSTMETAEGGLARNRPQSGLSSRYRFWPRRCQLELDQLVFFLFFFFLFYRETYLFSFFLFFFFFPLSLYPSLYPLSSR